VAYLILAAEFSKLKSEPEPNDTPDVVAVAIVVEADLRMTDPCDPPPPVPASNVTLPPEPDVTDVPEPAVIEIEPPACDAAVVEAAFTLIAPPLPLERSAVCTENDPDEAYVTLAAVFEKIKSALVPSVKPADDTVDTSVLSTVPLITPPAFATRLMDPP
jgi:hypothetical protein